jgi:hypothetical protein
MLQYLIKRRKPVTLDIQRELVDNKKNLNETGAGQELRTELEKQRKKYEKELADLRQEMGDALHKMDQEMKQQLQAERLDLERKLREAREQDHQLYIDREELRQQQAFEAEIRKEELWEKLRQQESELARDEQRAEQQKERHKFQLQQSKVDAKLKALMEDNETLRQQIDSKSSCVVM